MAQPTSILSSNENNINRVRSIILSLSESPLARSIPDSDKKVLSQLIRRLETSCSEPGEDKEGDLQTLKDSIEAMHSKTVQEPQSVAGFQGFLAKLKRHPLGYKRRERRRIDRINTVRGYLEVLGVSITMLLDTQQR